MRRGKWFRLLGVLLALTLVAAACGDDDDDGGGGGAADGDDTELESGPGFDGETIRLGVISPTTGPVAVIGNPLTNGNRVYWEAVNEEQGGVAGRYRVELEIVDSRYDPPTAVQQYNRIKNDVVLFNQILGTPVVSALREQLVNDNIVAQPASLDAFWVRVQHLLPIGGPYQIQAINAMDWVVNQNGLDGGDEGGGDEGETEGRAAQADEAPVICFAGHDDPYGDAGFEGLEFAAEEMGFDIAADVRFTATDTEFGAQVGQLSEAGCEVVFLTAVPSTAGGVLGTAAAAGFAPQWLGQSPTWVNALAASELGPYLEANFHLIAEGPEWGDTSVAGMEQMIGDVEQYAPDQGPDIYFAFGYGASWAVHQVLEQAVENGDLSRDGIIEAMNDVDALEFDGLFGEYTYGPPEDRRPPRVSRVFSVVPGEENPLRAQTEEFSSDAAEAFTFE